jgi:hypothetical protein
MTFLAALAEPVLVTAFLGLVFGCTWFLCERSGLTARWNRHTAPDLVVRRPAESPTELYLRRQRENARSWQEADR